jgi:putative lysine/arginine/ornithine/histidine/octopine transport system permease protein
VSPILELFALGATGWGDELLYGLVTTIQVALFSFIFGVVAGLLGAVMKLSGNRIAYLFAHAYSVVFRAVPELLIISVLYFGGSIAAAAILRPFGFKGYVDFSPVVSGVTALAIVTAAYAIEIFRGGMLAVSAGQRDAAYALGVGRLVTFFLIVLPQALRISLPGLCNLWLTVLKNTALLSAIGVVDLLRAAYLGASATRDPLPFFSAVAVGYIFLTWLSMIVITRLEERTKRGYADHANRRGRR